MKKGSQLKSGVMLSYVHMALQNLISLVYTPFMLKTLGQSDFGLFNLVNSVVSYLGLLSFGFSSAYTRYYYKAKADGGEKEVAKTNGMFFVIFAVIGTVALIAGMIMVAGIDIVFGNSLTNTELEKARIIMILSVINTAISFFGYVFNAHINAKEKFVFVKLMNIATTICSPMITLPLLLMGYRVVMIPVVSLILKVITTAINVYFSVYKLEMKFSFKGLQFGKVKEMFAFSFFIFLNQVVDQLNWNVDKYVIGYFSGTASVAVYSIGASINSIYVSISSSISSVFAPRINRMVADTDDNGALTDLMIRVGRIQFMILALILTGFIFFGYYFLIGYYAGPGYEKAYAVTLLLISPITIPLIQNIGIEIQRAKNRHQFRSIVYTAVAILNLLISIPLCKKYGILGSAFGTTLGITIGHVIIMNWFYHRRLGLEIPRFWINIFKLLPGLILPVAFGVVCAKIIVIDNAVKFLVCGFVYVAIYGASMWIFAMNESERELISKPIRKMFKRSNKNAA